MKETEGQSSIRIRVLIVVAAVAALAIALGLLMAANANRIVSQNGECLDTTTGQTAQRVNALFKDSLRDIQTTAEVFEESMNDSTIDPNEAAKVLSLPQFDHTFFITPRGMAYKPDGTTGIATEKHYYTQGIQGESGVCYIEDALFDGESVIAFFAPIEYEGVVSGIVVCAYRESTVAQHMDAAFGGYQMPTYLCEADGRIIASATSEGNASARYVDDIFANASLEGVSLEQVNSAIGSGTPISFTYESSAGTGNAAVAKLASFDWVILSTFPAIVTNTMIDEANLTNVLLAICILAIAVIATALFMLQLRRRVKGVKVPGTLTHSGDKPEAEASAGAAHAEKRVKVPGTLTRSAPARVESVFASSLAKDIQTPAQLAKSDADEMDAEEAARLDAERLLREKERLQALGYQGRHILLTEDNAMATSIAQGLLELTGAEVEHAENGKAAVEMLLGNDPGYYDIVLMDIQMPTMNGYDATRAIRKAANQRPDLADIPVIALSADMFTDDIKNSQDAGMNDHIAKPLEVGALADMLQKWIGE